MSVLHSTWVGEITIDAADLLASARREILAVYGDTVFNECDLSEYTDDMLQTFAERETFLQDIYDWADQARVWVTVIRIED